MKKLTIDAAFTYRMGAGFAGTVNRTHPASIQPDAVNATNPPTAFGIPVLADATTNTVRMFIAADASTTAIKAYGLTVRPYPFQQSTSSTAYAGAALGSAAPAVGQPIDDLTDGYILASVVGTAAKGAQAYVWCAASTGSHVQGGLEAAASSGNTVPLTNVFFNGPADASGVAEVRISQ